MNQCFCFPSLSLLIFINSRQAVSIPSTLCFCESALCALAAVQLPADWPPALLSFWPPLEKQLSKVRVVSGPAGKGHCPGRASPPRVPLTPAFPLRELGIATLQNQALVQNKGLCVFYKIQPSPAWFGSLATPCACPQPLSADAAAPSRVAFFPFRKCRQQRICQNWRHFKQVFPYLVKTHMRCFFCPIKNRNLT